MVHKKRASASDHYINGLPVGPILFLFVIPFFVLPLSNIILEFREQKDLLQPPFGVEIALRAIITRAGGSIGMTK